MDDKDLIESLKKDLRKAENNIFSSIFDKKGIEKKRVLIHAAEALRDTMTAAGAGLLNGTSNEYCVNVNNYTTYSKMVEASYRMYESFAKYGSELYGALLNSRVAFIGGQGPTATSDNDIVQKWANNWFKLNNLNGARNIRFLTGGELEGQYLMRLIPVKSPPAYVNNGEDFISVYGFRYYGNNYTINKYGGGIVYKISYKNGMNDVNIGTDNAVYVELGEELTPGSHVYGLMRILTQIENSSRVLFDINHSASLNGFPKETYKVPPGPTATKEIKAISDQYKSKVEPTRAYIGTGEFKYATPDSGSINQLLEALKACMRIISINTGIPLHLLSWPELLSNRATADSMLESISNAVSTPMDIWEGAYRELIYKARVMTVEIGQTPKGISVSEFLKAEIKVKMSLSSFQVLKQVVDIWLPLFEKSIIDKDTLRNMIPGIDPAFEAMKEKENKENEENIQTENTGIDGESKGDTGVIAPPETNKG